MTDWTVWYPIWQRFIIVNRKKARVEFVNYHLKSPTANDWLKTVYHVKRYIFLRARLIGRNQTKFFHQLSVSKGFGVPHILWRKYSIEYSNFGFKLPLFHAQKLKNLLQPHRLRRLTKSRRKGDVIFQTTSRKVKFLKGSFAFNSWVTWYNFKDMSRGFNVKQLKKQIQEISSFVLDYNPTNWRCIYQAKRTV